MLRSKNLAAPGPTHDDGPPAANSIASAVHLIHRAGQCADELFTQKLPSADMTPRQYAVLKAVERSEEPSQNDIVAMTGIDRSTIADIARRLVERGWLSRRRTRRDARMYALRLTAKGQAVLRLVAPGAEATDEQLLAPLSHSERAQLIDALERIVDAAKQQTHPALNGSGHGDI